MNLLKLVGMAVALIVTPLMAAETLVTVDGKAISEAELDGGPKAMLLKAKSQYYSGKKRAVDEYLFNYLIDLEAKKQKKTTEQLLKSRISKAEVKKFYDDWKSKQRPGRKIPALAEVEGQIRPALARGEYFAELKRRYKVSYGFGPERMKVAVGDLPIKGSKKAPVTIVEFSDFQCPYCKRASETVDEVMKKYKGKVKLHFRDFPLGFHNRAKPAAVAARCAGDQGKFWPYHDKLFGSQKLEDADLNKYAKELKLDVGKFDACLKSNKYAGQVDRDMQEGSALGVTGTPAFFINGIMLSGAVPFENFKEVIDEELVRLKSSKGNKSGTVMP